jgi:hypothetical protein
VTLLSLYAWVYVNDLQLRISFPLRFPSLVQDTHGISCMGACSSEG